MSKRKKRKSPLNDLVKFQVRALAKLGYSHRYMASKVFHKTLDRVSDSEVACVQGFCHRNQLRVSAWRNGLTVQSRQHAMRCMKPPKKKRRHRKLRVAA